MIGGGFNNLEYFTEESYNGIIRANSKMGDEVLITPNMDISNNMISPVLFKIMSDDNSESSMFKIDSSGVVILKEDVSGNASVGDSFTTKVVAMDASNSKIEAELIIDVSDVVSTFINPVEKNEKVTYSDMNTTINNLLSNINKGMSELSLANSNNISGDEESDDIIESFTNQKGGYYYL